MTTTQDQAEQMLAYWQTALRLQDWDIAVEICEHDRHEMSNYGELDYRPTERTARIRLADDECCMRITGRAGPPVSIESSLVHELLEIHFCDLGDRRSNEAINLRFEQAFNAIAECLVGLRHRAHGDIIEIDEHGRVSIPIQGTGVERHPFMSVDLSEPAKAESRPQRPELDDGHRPPLRRPFDRATADHSSPQASTPASAPGQSSRSDTAQPAPRP